MTGSGHGTFVSSLAAGSVENGVGISGFGGDAAKLLVVQAIDADGYITDVDEAAAIVYAVKHGAKIVNLSIGGPATSAIERRAIRWAANRGVLIVAAAGNEHEEGNAVEYPAALLQPVGSRGRGGIGLAVGASQMDGSRAPFSNTGSYISLAAPGSNVFAAGVGRQRLAARRPRGSRRGYYGWARWHLLRGAPGGGSSRARLGRESRAVCGPGGLDPQDERWRRRLELSARLGPPRRPEPAVELATRATPWVRRAIPKPRRFWLPRPNLANRPVRPGRLGVAWRRGRPHGASNGAGVDTGSRRRARHTGSAAAWGCR